MNETDLLHLLDQNYPGPFAIEARLATNGARAAYRARAPGGLYVVKVTDPDRPEKTVRSDVQTQAYLSAQGYPAPRPLPASDGQLFRPAGDRFIYLYEYLAGQHPTPGDDFYPRLGALLARLHRLPWQGSPVPQSDYRPPQILANTRADLLRVEPPEQRALLPELLGLIDAFPDFSGLPLGIIHTDPYLVNLIEDERGGLWLIDWDDGGVSYPLLDVGYCVAHLCSFSARDRQIWGVPGPETGVSFRPDWAAAFLRAYQSVRPLTRAERALLPAAVQLSFLCYLPIWGTPELAMQIYERMHLLAAWEAGL